MNIPRMAAAVLGATLALAAMSCEPADATTDFVVTAHVTEESNYDQTVRIFTLRLGTKDGAVTVMGSRDLPLVQFLGARVGQRIPITFGEGQ
jgi:hypothetical protein